MVFNRLVLSIFVFSSDVIHVCLIIPSIDWSQKMWMWAVLASPQNCFCDRVIQRAFGNHEFSRALKTENRLFFSYSCVCGILIWFSQITSTFTWNTYIHGIFHFNRKRGSLLQTVFSCISGCPFYYIHLFSASRRFSLLFVFGITLLLWMRNLPVLIPDVRDHKFFWHVLLLFLFPFLTRLMVQIFVQISVYVGLHYTVWFYCPLS